MNNSRHGNRGTVYALSSLGLVPILTKIISYSKSQATHLLVYYYTEDYDTTYIIMCIINEVYMCMHMQL